MHVCASINAGQVNARAHWSNLLPTYTTDFGTKGPRNSHVPVESQTPVRQCTSHAGLRLSAVACQDASKEVPFGTLF